MKTKGWIGFQILDEGHDGPDTPRDTPRSMTTNEKQEMGVQRVNGQLSP